MKKFSSHYAGRLLTNAMCGLLMIVSCDDDKPQILPSVIQFSTNLQNVAEGEDATVLLTLDRPAPDNGSVQLALQTNAVYDQHYETDPSVNDNTIVLEVRKGQTSVEFKIVTVNNDKYEGTRFIVFQLTPQSDGLKAGEVSALTLTIGDDEGPSLANFTSTSATINETDVDGILVEIPFAAPARGEGSLTVTLHAGMAIQGTNFTIDQELINHTFSFNVVRNTTGVRFKVFPLSNDLFTGDFPLIFTITEVSGVVQKGNNSSYKLIIDDDEDPSFARFAFASSSVEETNTEGVVVDILLSGPVKGEGTMTINYTTAGLVYGTDFTTLPESEGNRFSLEFSHDQTSASFKVFPRNDDLLNKERTLLFSITYTSGPIRRAGETLSHELTIGDDEKPSIANFAVSSASVDETNGSGIEVQITFSHPTAGPGQIVLDVDGFAGQFTSDPEVEERDHYDSYSSYYSYYKTYHITIDVPFHASGATFRIFPINDRICVASQQTTLTIAGASGALTKENEPKFVLTIKDDEDPMIVTLSELAGTLNESDATGKEILLNFSKPAVRDGIVWVYLDYNNHYYSGRYSTAPQMDYSSGYYAPLEFKTGGNGVAFKILPVNDHVAKGDFIEPFHFSYFEVPASTDDCVQIMDKTFTLTFVDDD